MLPPTSFQQLLLPRLAKARDRLSAMIWAVDPAPLAVWQTRATAAHGTFDDAKGEAFDPVKDRPHHWGRMFDQCWWRVEMPAADESATRYLRWLDQGEATVYVDGVPYYGIDPGHPFAPLPTGCETLHIESLCARTGVWVTGEPQGLDPSVGSRFDGAFLASRNDEAWHAFHDLEVLIRVAGLMSRPEYPPGHDLWGRGAYRPEITLADPLFRKLIDRMNRAIDALDAEGVAACRGVMRTIYDDLPAAPDAMTAVLTGHAHVDLVWLWPEKAGEFKAVHSFANALHVMSQYPEATFGYSQPASYEAAEKRSPALLAKVRDAIGRGNWEATGAMYVESDVQLPCGEALVRAFELGQQGFRGLTGRDSRCVWLPDVFGYSACLPTIMAGFGVPYFYTTKLHWSGATRFPYSSFRWVGMDGSVAVSHISWNHYNQEVTPEELHKCNVQHRQSAVHGEGLFPCGYGDGGGGLTEAMCERARRLENLASMPRAQWGTIESFFDRLNERRGALPSWRGEMYLEFHRGVQTTHGRLKAAFRAAERGLQIWEAVRCATGGGPVDEAIWKRVCFAQFHDYIPGSSIQAVYDEAVPELEQIAETCLRNAERELSAAADPGDAEDCVFNPLPMKRRTLLDGRCVELPPLAGVVVASLETVPTKAVNADERTLSNGRVAATFSEDGEIASLVVDGHVVSLAEPVGQAWTFPDMPAAYDAWDIDRYTLSNGTHHRACGSSEVREGGGEASVTFTRRLGEAGSMSITYRLEAGSAAMILDVDLELNAPQTLVKLAFPTAYRGREARYGGPFGSVKRPQWAGPLSNEAMFENPASRWACVADDDERDGLMLISEAKYGFGVREGVLHVSLARSAQVTAPNVSGGTTTLANAQSGKTYADLGRHRIRLALGRFRADAPAEEQPAALADTLFTPPIRYRGRPIDAGFFGVEGPPSWVPAWAKPHPDGSWTLRLHETLGGRGAYQTRLADGLKAVPTDLRDEPLPDASAVNEVTPYTLHSLHIRQ